MTHRLIILLLIVTTAATGICSENSESHRNAVFAQFNELNIACPKDAPPYYFADDTGRIQGSIADLWRLWSEKTGIKVRFVSGTWEETFEMIRQKRADIHAGLFFSETRNAFLDFSTPVGRAEVCIFSHQSIPKLTVLNDLNGFVVGTVKGTYAGVCSAECAGRDAFRISVPE